MRIFSSIVYFCVTYPKCEHLSFASDKNNTFTHFKKYDKYLFEFLYYTSVFQISTDKMGRKITPNYHNTNKTRQSFSDMTKFENLE